MLDHIFSVNKETYESSVIILCKQLVILFCLLWRFILGGVLFCLCYCNGINTSMYINDSRSTVWLSIACCDCPGAAKGVTLENITAYQYII